MKSRRDRGPKGGLLRGTTAHSGLNRALLVESRDNMGPHLLPQGMGAHPNTPHRLLCRVLSLHILVFFMTVVQMTEVGF